MDPIDCYSHWLEQAYPHSENRQRYLRERMQKAVISSANFRLAHLLLDQTVTNLVITTNFDDLLARALTLFGCTHIVCDHPKTLERIDLRSPDVQIIHLHGSYWFYDCCNLKAEIADRAQTSTVTSFSMQAVLERIFSDHSPLVVGYSGWEGDVFMTALQRRLRTRLRTNLYWFCYQEEDARKLPAWLTSSPDVRVVLPEAAPAKAVIVSGVTDKAQAPSGGRYEAGSAASLSEPDGGALSLPAREVFDKLIQTFRPPNPELTEDPLGFFVKSLTGQLVDNNSGDSEGDIYQIHSVIAKLEKLQVQVKAQLGATQADALEPIRNAIREANYREAVHLSTGLDLPALTPEQKRELSSALWDGSRVLDDNSDDEIKCYDLIVSLGDQLPRDGSVDERVAKALVNKGVALAELNRSEEAVALYDEVLRRFGESSELALRERVARALVNKGVRLGKLNRGEEEIAVYDEVLHRFGEASEHPLRQQVAMALVNKGLTLGELNRREEAIAVCDEVLRRFGEASEPGLHEQVAGALVNKGVRLGELNRREEAIAAYDEVLRRFGEANEPALRELVAQALVNKGVTLGALKRSEEEIAVYNELLRRFGESSEPALREQVARALFYTGLTQGELNRSEEAIAAYDEVVRRFGEATEPAIRELVEKARSARKRLKPDSEA